MKKKLNRGAVLLVVSFLILIGGLLGIQARNQNRIQKYRPILEESTQKMLQQLQEREGKLDAKQLLQQLPQWNLGLSEKNGSSQYLLSLIEGYRQSAAAPDATRFQFYDVQYLGRKEGLDQLLIQLKAVNRPEGEQLRDRYTIHAVGELNGDSVIIRMVDWSEFMQGTIMQGR